MTPLIPLFGGSWLATPPPPPHIHKKQIPLILRILSIFQQKNPVQNEQSPRDVGSHGMFKASVTCTNETYKQPQKR